MTIPLDEWGTLGVSVNFVSFGETVVSTEDDAATNANSSEVVGAISYGTKLTQKSSIGLTIKFFYSDYCTFFLPEMMFFIIVQIIFLFTHMLSHSYALYMCNYYVNSLVRLQRITVAYICCMHLLYTFVAYICCMHLLYIVIYICYIHLLHTFAIYICCIHLLYAFAIYNRYTYNLHSLYLFLT